MTRLYYHTMTLKYFPQPNKGTVLIDTPGTRISRIDGEITGIRSEAALQRSLENACLIANVCESFRGKETLVLDLTDVTPLFDFFVITTGNSRRQLRSIAEAADDVLASRNSNRMGREGHDAPWICHDYGDIVLHVFSPDARVLYDLENLWGDAVQVDWQAILAAKSSLSENPSLLENSTEAPAEVGEAG
ncbi:MAG TPA: ribosome silencing factor [Planctomicrobium sp.]|nr:ribosome silencing factor [Planctomicrobium sp.]